MEKNDNPNIEEIRRQVNEWQRKGYDVIGMAYTDQSEHPREKQDAKPTSAPTTGETDCFGYENAVEKELYNISRTGTPAERQKDLFSYTPPANPASIPEGYDWMRTATVIPVSHKGVGSKGKGYIPYGPANNLPVFIFNTSTSLPYTARSLGYLRDEIVGLGVEFRYRFTIYRNGDVYTKEIPYKDAGVLILGRIRDLEEKKKQADDPDAIANLIGRNSEDNNEARPGSIDYELQQLRAEYTIWRRTNEEVTRFEQENDLHKHFLKCMTDFVPMEIYYPLIGLSRGVPGEEWKPKIVRLSQLDCVATRLEEMDKDRNIKFVYHSDVWRYSLGYIGLVPRASEMVAYPALPETGTSAALRAIVRNKKNVSPRNRPTWFCIPRRMPCMNALYYPVPNWWSIYTSQVYQYASTLIADRAAARINATMWGKIILVNHAYMDQIYATTGCDTPEKQAAKRRELKKNIDDFLRNRKNNGSTVMFEEVVAPNGSDLWPAVKIIDVPMTDAVRDASKSELTEISNIIFLTMGIHSMLIGNPISATGTSNGGTAQRELDLLKQKQLSPMQKDYLDLLQFIASWNDWDPAHGVWRAVQMSLTTLDSSKTGITTINEVGEKI